MSESQNGKGQNGKVVKAFCLCDKDIGGDLPGATATMLCKQRGYATEKNLNVEYGNILHPMKKGEKISNYMRQYIHSVNGDKYLSPKYSVVEYNETIKKLNASICIYLILEGTGASSDIERTILDRAARLRAIGRLDEAISCLGLGWAVANRSPIIKKEATRAKYDFAIQLQNTPDGKELSDMLFIDAGEGVVQLLSTELSDDIELFELQILIAYQSAKFSQDYLILKNGQPQKATFEEFMRAGINEFRARNGVSKEVDRIESTLYDKSKSSFFGRKS